MEMIYFLCWHAAVYWDYWVGAALLWAVFWALLDYRRRKNEEREQRDAATYEEVVLIPPTPVKHPPGPYDARSDSRRMVYPEKIRMPKDSAE